MSHSPNRRIDPNLDDEDEDTLCFNYWGEDEVLCSTGHEGQWIMFDPEEDTVRLDNWQ